MIHKVKGYVTFLLENSLFLIIGTLVGLIWANLDWASYEQVAHDHTFHFVVNELGMMFFFGIAAKEVFEAILPGGALSSPRKAAMPLLATIGGMAGPALLFIAGALILNQPELMRGWAIPCATDIAFSYLVARFVFGAKHPAIPFLLLLAIADDGLGLLILALFYPTKEVNLIIFGIFVALAVALALAMRRMKVMNFWPYILGSGALSWWGFYQGGFHPALALVPVMFCMPHAKADIGIFSDQDEPLQDPLNRFEHWWENPVQVILGLFGFVNAGVVVTSVGPGTWLVVVGLLVGKPLGIILLSLAGRLFGLTLPEGMRWSHLVVVGCAAAVGFTVALFVSTVAFRAGDPNLDHVKMGSLLSFSAMILTVVVAKLLRIWPQKTSG